MNKVEAIVDALAHVNSAHDPGSVAYKLRNPLLLRSFAKPGRHDVNTDGLRVFGSLLAGLKAAEWDVKLKIEGNSRSKLKPTNTLEDLLRVYGLQDRSELNECVNFIRRALDTSAVSLSTPLSYFIEGSRNGGQSSRAS